jgi:diguanylate cyclase (GGDEF)-like protein
VAAAAPVHDPNAPLDADDQRLLLAQSRGPIGPSRHDPNTPLDADDRRVLLAQARGPIGPARHDPNAPLDAEDQQILGAVGRSDVPRPQAPDVILPPNNYAAPRTAPGGAGGASGGSSVAGAPAAPAAPPGRPLIDPGSGRVIDPTTGQPMIAGQPHAAPPPGAPVDWGTFGRGVAHDVGQVVTGEAGARMAGSQVPEPPYQPRVDPGTGRVIDPTFGQPFTPGQPHEAARMSLAGQALSVATPALQGAQKYGVDPLFRVAALVVNPVHAWLHSGVESAGKAYAANPGGAGASDIIQGFLRGTFSEEGARAALAGLTSPDYVQTAPFSATGFRDIPIAGMKPGSPADELTRGVLNWLADVPLDILTDMAASKLALKPLGKALSALDRITEARGLHDAKIPLPAVAGGPRSLREIRTTVADNRDLARMIGGAEGRSGENLRQALAAKIATAKDMNALRESGVPLFRKTPDGRTVNQVDEQIYHWIEAGSDEAAKYPDRAAAEEAARGLGPDAKTGQRVVDVVKRNGANYARVWRQTGERLEKAGFLRPGTVEAMGDRYAARMYQSASHNAEDIEAWLAAAQEVSDESGGKYGVSDRAVELGNQIMGRPGTGGGVANRAKSRKVASFAEREARGGEFQASPIFAKSVPAGERIAARQEVLAGAAGRFGSPGYEEVERLMKRDPYTPEDLARAQKEVGDRQLALGQAQDRLGEVAGQPATPGVIERRKDLVRRKAIAEMSLDEAKEALGTDELTGLKNKRSWYEWHGYNDENGVHHPGEWERSGKKERIVSVDADSLKYVNDTYGHEAGDALLRAVGDALREVGLGADFFHVSGDEFYGRTLNPAETEARLKAADEWMRAHAITVKSGSGEFRIRGLGVSHGIGEDFNRAEEILKQAKGERETAGLRGGRGERPPGLVEEPGRAQSAGMAGVDRQPAGPSGRPGGVTGEPAPEGAAGRTAPMAGGETAAGGVGADRPQVRAAGGEPRAGIDPGAGRLGAARGAAPGEPQPGYRAPAAGAPGTAEAHGTVKKVEPFPRSWLDQKKVPAADAGAAVDRYQFLRNKEGGQRFGTQYEVRPLTESFFQQQVRPLLAEHPDYASITTLAEWLRRFPERTHYEAYRLGGKGPWYFQLNHDMSGIGPRQRLVPAASQWFSRKVQSFDLPEARQWGAKADSEMSPPGAQTTAAGPAPAVPAAPSPDRVVAAPGGSGEAQPIPPEVQNLRDRVSESQQGLTAAQSAYQKIKTPATEAALADAKFRLRATRSMAGQMEREWRESLPRAGETPEAVAVRVSRKEVADAQAAVTAAKKTGDAGALTDAQERAIQARTRFKETALAYQRSRLPKGSIADRYASQKEAAIAGAQAVLDRATEAYAEAHAAYGRAGTPASEKALAEAGEALDAATVGLRKEQRSFREGLRLSDAVLSRRMEQETRDAALQWANAQNQLGRIQREVEGGPPTVRKPLPVPPGSRLLTGRQYGPAEDFIVPAHVKEALDAYLAPGTEATGFMRGWQNLARFYKSQAMFLNFPSLIHKGKYDTALAAGALADAGLKYDPITMSRGLAKAATDYRAWTRGGKMSPALAALDQNTRALLPQTGDLGDLGSSLRNALGEKPPNMTLGFLRKARDFVPKRIGDIERTYKVMLTEALSRKYGYEEAARIAQETIGDAANTSPIVQTLERYGGIPFLTARIKALPKLARTAVRNPGIIRQLSGIPLAQGMQAALPPDQQQRAQMLGPGAIPLPGVKDAAGRPRFVTRNPLAVSPLADIGGLGGGLGGFVGAGIEAYGNADWQRTLMTGKAESITRPGEMPPLDALGARVQFVEDRLEPSFLRAGQRIQRASEGTTRFGGPYQEPETLTDAVLGIVTGTKLGPAETQIEQKERAQKMAGPAGRALIFANRYLNSLESGQVKPPDFPFLGQISDPLKAREAYKNAKQRLKEIVTGQQYKGDQQAAAIQRQVAWLWTLQNRYIELARAQEQIPRQ